MKTGPRGIVSALLQKAKDYPSVSVALKESGQVSEFKFIYYSTFKLVVNQQGEGSEGAVALKTTRQDLLS